MKSKIIITIAGLTALIFFGCSDSGTGSDPKNDPTLSVNQTDITLSGNPRWDRFDLMNDGGGQLEWIIENKPDWVDISEVSGLGVTSTDTVTIRIATRFDELDYGTYDGEIKISSNGGQQIITLKLEYKAPQLKIDNRIINMDRHYRYSELTLMNEGGGELEWKITNRPEWLQFDLDSGKVYNQPEMVPFRAQVHTLDYGEYEDKVIIQSNGGDFEINVFLTYEREVEVYAGIGAANIELGDTYLMVEKLFGKPDKSGYVRPEDTIFIHNVSYADVGLDIRVKNNSPILFGNGQVGFVRMINPYDGMTAELIGLGSSTTDLFTAVGEPQQKNGSEWIYEGITYVIRQNKVSEMIIKEPDF